MPEARCGDGAWAQTLGLGTVTVIMDRTLKSAVHRELEVLIPAQMSEFVAWLPFVLWMRRNCTQHHVMRVFSPHAVFHCSLTLGLEQRRERLGFVDTPPEGLVEGAQDVADHRQRSKTVSTSLGTPHARAIDSEL